MTSLNHFDASGQAHMVDVGDKRETQRIAVACGQIRMLPATLDLIKTGGAKKVTYSASPASPPFKVQNAPRI